jgi:SAM-dependent methyltransferase
MLAMETLTSLAAEWQRLPFPESAAADYARKMHAEPLDYYVRRVDRLGLRGREVLDAGCGTGTWSFALRTQFDRVVGVDRNEPRVEMARWIAQRHGADIAFDVGDITALPYDDGRFDTVVCYGVVISYLDIGVVLRELARVLSPGGTLYLCLNGIGWAMLLRDERGATDARIREIGLKGIYHTLTARLVGVREALLAAGDELLPALEQGGLDELDRILAERHGVAGLAATARLIGDECGAEYERLVAEDAERMARGEAGAFSHARAERGHVPSEVREAAEAAGLERLRWAEEGQLVGADTVGADAAEPIYRGWYRGHLAVWECLLRRRA